jgi:hypothetical protein
MIVHSYLVDVEYVNAFNRVGKLYVLLMDAEHTYLCRYQKPVLVRDQSLPSVRDFLNHVPKPFEDEVSVEPSVLRPDVLNRISTLRSVGEESRCDWQKFSTRFSGFDYKVKLSTERRRCQPSGGEDPIASFVETEVDLSLKQSLREYVCGKYLKTVQATDRKTFRVPKRPEFSFIDHQSDAVVKIVLEESSEFVVATSSPRTDIELRKICLFPRFTYAAVFRNNTTAGWDHEDRPLLYSDGQRTMVVSKDDEILDCCQTLPELATKVGEGKFQTNSAIVRRLLPDVASRNICIRPERNIRLKRLLKLLRNGRFVKERFLLKKSVVYLDGSRACKTVNVHDFRNFYASTIIRSFEDEGMKDVFRRLVAHRSANPGTKRVLTKLFGLSKRYYPKMFYQTLNETVRLMFRTYLRNRSHVFAMCKDSFFTASDTLQLLPDDDYAIKIDHRLKEFAISDINTYAGIDARTGSSVIKGLSYPPFTAAAKIVRGIHAHLAERGRDGCVVDLVELIRDHIALSEEDFNVSLDRERLKPSDYFHLGLNEDQAFRYSIEDAARPLTQSAATELRVRPAARLGRVDVKRYVKEILVSVIQFSRTFGYLEVINENVIYEADLFLQQYIQKRIFERTDRCNLPGLRMHECQLTC